MTKEELETIKQLLEAHIDLHYQLADEENRGTAIQKVSYVIKTLDILKKYGG